MNLNYVPSASFDPENARELGIPAAILLDKILRLQKVTPRSDGFCWYTAKQFEEETSLRESAFTNASKKLEDMGIVERKMTYIIGTMTKASHFRVLIPCETRDQEPVRDTGSVNTINNTINTSSADASDVAPKEAEVLSSLPFDENIKIVDVSKPKNRQTANAKAGVAVNKMCDVLGLDKRGQNVSVANAKHLLDKGYTVDELVGLAEWAKKSEFYKNKPLHTILGNDAMQQYQIEKNKKNDNGVVKGFSL